MGPIRLFVVFWGVRGVAEGSVKAATISSGSYGTPSSPLEPSSSSMSLDLFSAPKSPTVSNGVPLTLLMRWTSSKSEASSLSTRDFSSLAKLVSTCSMPANGIYALSVQGLTLSRLIVSGLSNASFSASFASSPLPLSSSHPRRRYL